MVPGRELALVSFPGISYTLERRIENRSLCCLSHAWREQHKAHEPGIRVTPGCTAQMWLVRWGGEGRDAVDWDQLGGRATYSQHLSLVI